MFEHMQNMYIFIYKYMKSVYVYYVYEKCEYVFVNDIYRKCVYMHEKYIQNVYMYICI